MLIELAREDGRQVSMWAGPLCRGNLTSEPIACWESDLSVLEHTLEIRWGRWSLSQSLLSAVCCEVLETGTQANARNESSRKKERAHPDEEPRRRNDPRVRRASLIPSFLQQMFNKHLPAAGTNQALPEPKPSRMMLILCSLNERLPLVTVARAANKSQCITGCWSCVSF